MSDVRLNLRSPREIRKLRWPGLVVWRAHQAAAPLVRPGVTTAELDAAVESVFQIYGATPLFKGYPGETPFPAATCTSVNEQVVHGIPGDRVLKEGDIVSLDTGCKLDGWCGDAARTHPVGTVTGRTRKLLEVTQAALDLAMQGLAECSRWSEVAERMEKLVHQAGFSVIEDFVGHGVGREMHESPKVPNFVSAELLANDFPIRPGLVIAVEPMVNVGVKTVRCLADHWTQVTTDGLPSAHFENTIAVTSDGPRALTGPPETDEEHEFVQRTASP